MMSLLFSYYYMLIGANHLHYVNELKIMLVKEFDMKDLCGAKKILGMEIHKDMSAIKLWLSQNKL